MNQDTELSILKLELKKQQKICSSLERKKAKYEMANERVFNAVSQDDIDDVQLELDTKYLEIEILKAKIKELQ